MPGWVKPLVDDWLLAANLTGGKANGISAASSVFDPP